MDNLTSEFEPVRVGLIGVGRHARGVLLPALSLVPEISLCCLSTRHSETARAAADRYRVRGYVGFEDMLDHPGLEAVLVVGAEHGPVIAGALEAGLHVWSEMPAVDSTETATYLRQLVMRRRRIVEVGANLRHAPIYQRMRQLLLDWNEASPGPRLIQTQYYPYIGHFYNLMLYLNGAIEAVFATKGALETLVTARFANGDLGTVVSRRFENDSVPFECVSISGEDGLLTADDGRELHFFQARESQTATQLSFASAEGSVQSPTFSMPYGGLSQLVLRGYAPELQHFALRIRKGAAPVCDLDDMERTLLVREAVDRSSASGQWEEVASLGSR